MGQVTIKQLAAEVGLSVCTVNKALTGKPRISEETRMRILDAAERLGYKPNLLAQALARRTLTIGVVYPEVWPDYYRKLVDGVRQGLAELYDHNIQARYRTLSATGSDLGTTLQELVEEGVAGVILCSSGHPSETAAWPTLTRRNLPCILLGNDIACVPRLTAVRLDARRCGRLAAELLCHLTAGGPLAILVGNTDIMDHQDKIAGFREEAAQLGCTVTGIYETQDDPALAYPATQRVFAEHPETAGIYIATDNALGVCRYVRESERKIKLVATGVFPELREYIAQGTVQFSLHQNMERQGLLAVRMLYRYLAWQTTPEPEVLVAPQVIARNLQDLWATNDAE